MRQVVSSLTAPVPDLNIVRIQSEQHGDGYNLLVVPRSAWRPHAVRVGSSLRYPRRDGPRIRYLSETEVADAYRSRFAAEASQSKRLAEVHAEGVERLDVSERLWLTASLVPNTPGQTQIDRAGMARFRQMAEKYNGGFGSMVFGGFDLAPGFRRVVIRTREEAGHSRTAHVELHTDGSGFAAAEVWDQASAQRPGRLSPGGANERTPWLRDEYLVTQLIGLVRLLVEHAVTHAAVTGDGALRVSLDGFQRKDGHFLYPLRIMHYRNHGIPEPRFEVLRPPVSLHTIDVAASAVAMSELLVSARLAMTDIFQAFGVPELE